MIISDPSYPVNEPYHNPIKPVKEKSQELAPLPSSPNPIKTSKVHSYTKHEALPENIQGLAKQATQNSLVVVDQDKQISVISHIQFEQGKISNEMRLEENKSEAARSKYSEVREIEVRFNGFCELICNQVLKDDLLGKGKTENFLHENITPSSINSVKNSHLLNFYSVFRRIIAYVFGIYPDNLFSIHKQWELAEKIDVAHALGEDRFKNMITTSEYLALGSSLAFQGIMVGVYEGKYTISSPSLQTPMEGLSLDELWREFKKCSEKEHLYQIRVNRKLLESEFDKLEDGEILKFETFRKTSGSFEGHSCLIKKISKENYTFFDPNSGEHRNLSFHELGHSIDRQLDHIRATDLCFIKAKDYLKRLKDENIFAVANTCFNPQVSKA